MNESVKKLWVETLRSGQYEQTTGRLHTIAGFCCLGVLCDLYRTSHETEWVDNPREGEYVFLGQKSYLPDVVHIWAELEFDLQRNAMRMNDGGADFATIADVIESSP